MDGRLEGYERGRSLASFRRRRIGFDMVLLRRALAVLLGLGTAPAVGLVVLLVLVLGDPLLRAMVLDAGDVVLEAFGEAEIDPSAAEEADAFVAFLYAAVVAIGFVPILLVASFALLTKLGSWIYYATATGIVTAAMPWALRAVFHLPQARAASSTETSVAVVLFLAGIATGSAFWMVTTALDSRKGRRARGA
jgi:hypothetical protein